MTEVGKFAAGLRGFPTPNSAAGSAGYLLFRFLDKEYAQYILGAAKALEVGYNWYEAGDLSVDDAAEAFRLINQDAPYEKLPVCSLPTGEELMRIDPETGKIQNVDGDGNWQDNPDIPPTPSRPSGTPEDVRCLAAANAANALQILYENLSDSFSTGLTDAEAATALAVAIGEAIAAAFFPPAAALIAVAGAIFGVLYEVVEFVTADVWDDTFNDVLRCYLFDCASVDGENVVTFDWRCVIDKLAAQTDAFGLDATQIRLFGQIYYLLSYIGDDGLNYAGSATAIETADCSSCGGWHHVWDGCNDPAWTFFPSVGFGGGARGAFSGGEWISSNGPTSSELLMAITFPAPATITRIQMTFSKVIGNFDGAQQDAIIYDSSNGYYAGTALALSLSSTNDGATWGWDGTQDVTTNLSFWMFAASATVVTYGTVTATKIEIWGSGETDPFGDNC